MSNYHDLHSHSRYSSCGNDEPRTLIEAAIAGGINHFAITDHCYDIRDRWEEYTGELKALREEYKDRITLYIGAELATADTPRATRIGDKLGDIDFCLIEEIQHENSTVTDLFAYAKSFGIPCGIAHTDIFAYCATKGYDPLEFLCEMAQADIFWEMNVSFDSVHRYHEHSYVLDLINDPEKQRIVKRSGVKITAGSDCHLATDYLPCRVIGMNDFINDLMNSEDYVKYEI